jgi:hypothetical protein
VNPLGRDAIMAIEHERKRTFVERLLTAKLL